METPDYDEYMDKQQAINLGLFKRFEQEGIEFAYPTQTLFVERNGVEKYAKQF
jgi:small-conductance mechanosensitive channel